MTTSDQVNIVINNQTVFTPDPWGKKPYLTHRSILGSVKYLDRENYEYSYTFEMQYRIMMDDWGL